MPKKYLIRDGFSFVCDNNDVALGGTIIELSDDVAALHAHKLEPVQDEAATAPENSKSATKTTER